MFLSSLIKKNKKLLFSCFFVIATLAGVFFSYQYLFLTYFRMDEWSYYSEILRYGPFHNITSVGIIGLLTGETRTLGFLSHDLFFYFFDLNILPWQITFIILHLVNIFLLYKILRKFKLPQFSSFLSSFFFAIASAGQEALAWPCAGMQILGSTLFALLTILLTMRFNDLKQNKFLILAIICSYISFLWKPTGIVTPVLIISLFILFNKKARSARLIKIAVILGASTAILGLFRLLTVYSNKISDLIKALFDIFFFPFISISHIFIPYRLMFRLSTGFINFYYPIISKDGNIETITHLVVSDYISTIVSIFIIVCIFILYKKVNQYNKKVLIFGLIMYFVQYIPISLFYIDRGGLSYLESRHTYTSILGVSILLGIFFNLILVQIKNKEKSTKYLYLVFVLLIGFWFYKEMLVTRREVKAQAIDDVAIKKTWEAVKSLKLPNTNKLIIFLTSDRSYYYPEYRLPFKAPAAYMLPLAFYDRPFIDKSKLGEFSNDAFISSDNKQFGYFTNINTLVSLIRRGQIDIDSVFGLHFVDETLTFEITTNEIKSLIRNKQTSY